MSSLDQALATQIANIQTKTGKTLDELRAIVAQSGLTKHAEIRTMLQRDLGLGYGDANTLVHVVRNSDGAGAAQAAGATNDDVVDALYTGPRAALRPIHDRLMAAITGFGSFEITPKKGYVSLRRQRQFAMIGPATNTRVEVGLNGRSLEGTARLETQPPGGMCHFKVNLTDAAQVDDELIAWIRQAYDTSG